MSKKARILVIDDDPIVQQSCERILAEDYEIHVAENGHLGLAALASQSFHLALLDLKLPDMNGMDILRQAPDRFPDIPIIVITGYPSIKSTVEAIKMGAFDYLGKPFSPDELEVTIEKALRQRHLLTDYRALRENLRDRYQVSRLIGESPAMKRVFSLIMQSAKTDSTVLITGESGTGKELVARAIHFSGLRKDARFVAVDCGAIAPGLMASELFGHIEGAFTGASVGRQGLIQAAEGGTLFLDEIGNLALDLQAHLLRVIENREIRPVGTSESVKIDVRFIAATNVDLQMLVQEGRFREDLFYRLNVFPIRLVPLRERSEDIPFLARQFLAMFSARMHKRIEDFTPEAVNFLMQYEWPGNVRELSNVVERLVILCNDTRLGLAHLHQSVAISTSFSSVPQTAAQLHETKKKLREQAVNEIEKAFLLEALRRNDYNVSNAAQQTGMQRPNFQSLLRKHGLRIKDIAAGREPTAF
ncbi:MAG: sigma-54-dependent Fis family transcriptional regulator [Sedimentisphaerales bacterium]|nr:sigma-54-dependent Fis family transcriptional regulator [Sedimentisphaerales bacterium]